MWLAAQPGVVPARLGAFGFSMGGYFVAQVAARHLNGTATTSAEDILHGELRSQAP